MSLTESAADVVLFAQDVQPVQVDGALGQLDRLDAAPLLDRIGLHTTATDRDTVTVCLSSWIGIGFSEDTRFNALLIITIKRTAKFTATRIYFASN